MAVKSLTIRHVEPLSRGERLLIRRRRRKQTQEQAAREFGIGRNLYGRYESDVEDGPSISAPDSLREHEVALILRRRAGLREFQLGQRLGLSRTYVSMMEWGRSPGTPIIQYWRERVARR